MVRPAFSRILLALLPLVVGCAAMLPADPPADPCSLLAPAEIQAAIGKPVEKGTPKAHANPMAGSDCTYVVGGFGSLNILTKPLQRGETPAMFKAQFAKMKMTPVDAPEAGDNAFFTSPGFGMVQVHAFKAGRYALITLLVPGSDEKAVRPMAAKLMKTALSRIK